MIGLVLSAALCCPILEIRQYTLQPGAEAAFMQFYESNFIESQAAAAITPVGEFRVLDDPNRFFWIRGFDSMDARAASLRAFYAGAVWKQHRGEANKMLVETENVLLLHPAQAGSGFALDQRRAPIGATAEQPGILVATIYPLGASNGSDFDALFESTIRPVLTSAGARIIATLTTEHSANNFPVLRIRDDANVFAWLSCFAGEDAYARYRTALAADPRWPSITAAFATLRMYDPPEVWRLRAGPRSALHC